MKQKKRVKTMKKLHQNVRAEIEKANEKYKKKANKNRRSKSSEPGDLVWLHLRKERFPAKRKSKLMPRSEGPFKILEKYGDNAYKLELPGEYGVSATFNVGDLSPYLEDEEMLDLGTSPFEPEGTNAGADAHFGQNPDSDLNKHLRLNQLEDHTTKVGYGVAWSCKTHEEEASSTKAYGRSVTLITICPEFIK